jgi:hypothetical protein
VSRHWCEILCQSHQTWSKFCALLTSFAVMVPWPKLVGGNHNHTTRWASSVIKHGKSPWKQFFVGKIIYKRVFLSSAIFDDRVLALKSERWGRTQQIGSPAQVELASRGHICNATSLVLS